MRFSSAILALAASLAPASGSLFARGNQAVITDDDLKIPGDSPLELCPKEHDKDIVTIQSVNLTPNPPQAGTDLIIEAIGEVSAPILEGAYVLLQVKYGLIRLICTQMDLCEQIKNVDMDCPVEKGKIAIVKNVTLPAEIPSGKYTVFADVYTVDKEPITCLTATVVFSRSESKSWFEL